MFKQLKDSFTQEVYYEDVVDRTQYRRAVCSLAWPWSPLPGAVVVLAERRSKPNVLNEKRHIDLKAECINASVDELLSNAVRYMTAFKAPYLVTPCDDDRIILIDSYNDELRERKKMPIRLDHPTAWHGKGEGLFPYYISLIKARIVENKTLHFNRLSQLPAECACLTDDTFQLNSSMLNYPSICALAWAVEAIDTTQPHEIDTSALLQGPADRLGGY